MTQFNQITFFSVLKVVMTSMANFEKEYSRIQEFKNWVFRDVLSEKAGRVEGGLISDEKGETFNLALDTYGYWQRFVYKPTEPRILKWVKGWGVGLEDRLTYTPLNYRTDIAELPSGILVPLFKRIDQIQSDWKKDRSLLTTRRG